MVSELRADGSRDAYTVEPEDFGLRRAAHGDIAPLGDLRAEAVRFVQVLAGRGHEACSDAACLNVGRRALRGAAAPRTSATACAAGARGRRERSRTAPSSKSGWPRRPVGVDQRAAGEARLATLRAEAGLVVTGRPACRRLTSR